MNSWTQTSGIEVGDLDPKHELFVKTIFVDGGATLKRFQHAPQGRAYRIRKRTNHVTIVVANKVPLESEISQDESSEE